MLDEDIDGEFVRVRIKAKVATKSVFEKVQSLGGELEFRSVDGESKYAKIVTQKQQIKSAIETLLAAMQGYPEELIDIAIGQTRMAMEGVFNDGKEHLIVPLTFSWNNNAWDQFSNNLNEYLKIVSSDSNSFKMHVPGFKVSSYYDTRDHGPGKVREEYISKDSWLQVGWERCVLKTGHSTFIGRLFFDHKLKGMFDYGTVIKKVRQMCQYDYIKDVVIILDKNLKHGTSYAVSRSVWDSLYERKQQVPAFYLNVISKLDGSKLGRPNSDSELDYSLYMMGYISHSTGTERGYFSSIYAGGAYRWMPSERSPKFVNKLKMDYKNIEWSYPRYMVIAPYFHAGINETYFNANESFYISKLSYDYIVDLGLDEVKNVDRVEIETYVLDLYNKRRRDNGSQEPASSPNLGPVPIGTEPASSPNETEGSSSPGRPRGPGGPW